MSSDDFYPSDPGIEQHVSIFLLGFRHRVSAKHLDDWHARCERLGWSVHPFLCQRPEPFQAFVDARAFGPHDVMTTVARDTVFGTTWGDDPRFDGTTDGRNHRGFIEARLSSHRTWGGYVDNLLLTRDRGRCGWLNAPLRTVGRSGTELHFEIPWVDLWLFDDQCGLLAFKVALQRATPRAGAGHAPTLTDLGELHRRLRDWRDARVTVSRVDGDGSPIGFWDKVVFESWLGIGRPGSHLLLRDDEPVEAVFDSSSRYCKLLTGVQTGELGDEAEEMAWSAPLADPLPGYPYQRHYEELQRGDWGNAMLALQAAAIAGYPSFRDLFLFELATTSDAGDAGGHGGRRGWQVSREYVRRLFDAGGIDIWEYWSGLALRDVCAFVSWSRSMPLILDGQLEARYYPLYACVYHLRLELDHIAGNCVDHNMMDTQRLRAELRRFELFRSRYWFKEVTRDAQGVEVFAKMKRGLQIDVLFEAVSEEVNEVGDYLEAVIERGRQALMTLLLIAAYPLYLWLGQAAELPAVQALVGQLKALNAAQPWLGLLLILGVSLASALLLALLWKPTARLLGRLLQPIIAHFAQHRW